jgi:hypothetical protein
MDFPAPLLVTVIRYSLAILLEELFQLAHVRLLRSLAFHPQTDGQSEVTNRIKVMYLGAWLMIGRVLGSNGYRGQNSITIPLSSLLSGLLYGRPLPPLASYLPGSARVAAVDRQLRDRDEFFLAKIRDRLRLAQDVEFAVGD